MTREEKKAYYEAYYLSNKEKKKAYYLSNKEKIKAYYLANKERIKAYTKEYQLVNKENIEAYKKEYYIANKAQRKAHYLASKHEPLVYLLPKCNWVGTTECISSRIHRHKGLGRNTDNYKILKKFETRAEALDFERKMHDLGYKGRHKNNLYI